MSSLRRGHANLLCIVPILADDLFRGSNRSIFPHICIEHLKPLFSYGKILPQNIEKTRSKHQVYMCGFKCKLLMRTHKTKQFSRLTRSSFNTGWPRTWKVTSCDHRGGCDSVEQAHCTLSAVKRYRALYEGGGLPNFLNIRSYIYIQQLLFHIVDIYFEWHYKNILVWATPITVATLSFI